MLAVLATAAALVTVSAAQAAPPGPRLAAGATAPVISCAQLARLDLAGVPGAPTSIASATPVAASDNPLGSWSACEVKGVIAPQIQFQMLLPSATWTGRYLQTGCGGYCGSVSLAAPASYGCTPLTDGSFAVASDNEGHYGASGFDAVFGADPQLRVDFGYRSEHLLATVAKRLIREFYGRPATHSYFDGCSQGGHEGLTEAQRYPHDFDGIVAGAPASIMTALNVWYQGWNALANTDRNGDPILTLSDLAPLHAAVVKACDALDGTTDGLISDPLGCTFDPASIACSRPHASGAFCLTAAQVATVRKLYAGPRDRRGRLMYPGYQLRGSELNWAAWVVPTAPGTPTIDENIVVNTLRYLVYPAVRPSMTASDVHFTDRSFRRIMRRNAGIYDATDPDLSAFRRDGGKLIMWQGWADPAISPAGTVSYYRAVVDRMGGLARTQRFARLFMLPGVSHCSGGEGPDSMNALGAVVNWVEHGRAPKRIITSKLDGSGNVTATRPVYPYPLIAVDTTGGPADEAASYTAQLPPTTHGQIRWLGSFRPGYEKTCGWVDGHWVCRRGKA